MGVCGVGGGPFGGCPACVRLFRATDAGKSPFHGICRMYGPCEATANKDRSASTAAAARGPARRFGPAQPGEAKPGAAQPGTPQPGAAQPNAPPARPGAPVTAKCGKRGRSGGRRIDPCGRIAMAASAIPVVRDGSGSPPPHPG